MNLLIPLTMKFIPFLFYFLTPITVAAQINLSQSLKVCDVEGSITLYHLESETWQYSDSLDAMKETLPASTFKIANSAIALETDAISNEHEILKWNGRENTFFGSRIEAWNEDINMKKAFETSAVWFYVELAKRIGREIYREYLNEISYGNNDLTEPGDDFWNFGKFGVSPVNQIQLLINLHRKELPFSDSTIQIVREMMLLESTDLYDLFGKTGWTKTNKEDIGWWIGFVEKERDTWFFATRITKSLATDNPDFSACRMTITRSVLNDAGILE